jgi:hypothetical protein
MSEVRLTCANHPNRETTLRCNRCEKPICSQCAILTPVGYRCRDCVRGQQAVFETATKTDLPVAGILSAIGVGAATAVLQVLGYWGLLVAPVVGGAIAEIIRWAVRRRRSRSLPLAAGIGGALGLVPSLVFPVLGAISSLGMGLAPGILGGIALSAVWPLASGVLMIVTLVARLRGIRV